MSSLSEMPELVMENIIGLLDFQSVLALRQVYRNFQNFIDDLNDSKLTDSKFSKIEIGEDGDRNLLLIFENPDRSRHEFDYSAEGNSRSFNGKMTLLENSNILDVVIRDLERVLKFQKSPLRWFCFDLADCQRSKDSPFSELSTILSNMIKKLNRKIKTKSLFIRSVSQSGFMSILPLFDSETLEHLDLRRVDDEMQIEIDEIVKTEQWRKVKKVQSDFIAINMKVEDICHFSQFTITTLSISAKELDFLRKTITSSSKFDSSRLGIEMIFNENEELSSLWGPAIVSGNSHSPKRTWYFRVKDSDEKVLKLLSKNVCFRFEMIKLQDVPNGAIVNDYNEN